MTRIYKLEFGKHYSTGLGDDMTITEHPEVYLHFGHHTFSIEWDESTRRQISVEGKPTFYGGMGEGSTFDTWQDAVLASLYDAYQVNDCFHDGDMFLAEYLGERQFFVCQGVHVVKTSAFDQACALPGAMELKPEICTNRYCPEQPHEIKRNK